MAGKARATVGVRLIAEEQAALRRVAVRVAQGESPEEIFAAVAAEAGQVLHAEQAYIDRYDPDGTLSVVAAWTSGAAAAVPVGTRFSTGGRNLTTLIRQTGQPSRIDDYADISGLVGDIAHKAGDTETIAGVWDSTGAAPVAVGARVPLGGRNVSSLVFARGRGPDRRLRRRQWPGRRHCRWGRRPNGGRRAGQRRGRAVGVHDRGHAVRAAAG